MIIDRIALILAVIGIAAVWCISLLFRERDAADEA